MQPSVFVLIIQHSISSTKDAKGGYMGFRAKRVARETLDIAAEAAKILLNAVDDSGVTGGLAGGAIDYCMTSLVAREDYKVSVRGMPLVPNPHFVDNGFDDGSYEVTKHYFNGRLMAKIGGGLTSATGSVLSVTTGANVGGAVRHGVSEATTIAHIAVLASHLKTFKQSDWLVKQCQVLLGMKSMKVGIRGTQLAGDIAGGVSGAICGVAAAVTSKGFLKATDRLTTETAIELHWRAKQEQALLGGIRNMGKGSGPASNMVKELLTRRGFRRITGQYKWKEIIDEPAGWMVIQDKINLM